MTTEPPKLPDRFKHIPLDYTVLAYQYRDLLSYARSFIVAYDSMSDHAHSVQQRMISAIETSEAYQEAYEYLIALHSKAVYGEQVKETVDYSYSIPTEPWGKKKIEEDIE